jgi:FkbM family methyltransferase
MDGPTPPLPAARAAVDEPDDVVARRLLTWGERLKYALLPGAVHRWQRSRRTLQRGEVELRMLPFLVDPHRNAVDIGANKGTYTCQLARLCRHVFAYEPNPAMRLALRRVVPRNVTISSRAMSNLEGAAFLSIPRRQSRCANNTGTLRSENLSADSETIAVRQARLDDEGLSDVGFVKIDVEGFERQVLEGARELLRRERPVLLVEIIPEHTGRPVGETVAWVEQQGYRALAVNEGRLADWTTAQQLRAEQARRRMPVERLRNYLFLPLDDRPPAERAAA